VQRYRRLFIRTIAAKPKEPEPKSSKVLGSGQSDGLTAQQPQVELVVAAAPSIVNDSDGIVPIVFSWAWDGQPGDEQPMPEFSSQ